MPEFVKIPETFEARQWNIKDASLRAMRRFLYDAGVNVCLTNIHNGFNDGFHFMVGEKWYNVYQSDWVMMYEGRPCVLCDHDFKMVFAPYKRETGDE
jgi:hypothetical protein